MDIKLPALLLGPCFWSLGWDETAATAAGVIKLKFEKGPRGCCSREVFLCQRPGPVLSQRLTKAVAASPPPSRDLRKPSEQSAPKRRRLFRIARLHRSRATPVTAAGGSSEPMVAEKSRSARCRRPSTSVRLRSKRRETVFQHQPTPSFRGRGHGIIKTGVPTLTRLNKSTTSSSNIRMQP